MKDLASTSQLKPIRILFLLLTLRLFRMGFFFSVFFFLRSRCVGFVGFSLSPYFYSSCLFGCVVDWGFVFHFNNFGVVFYVFRGWAVIILIFIADLSMVSREISNRFHFPLQSLLFRKEMRVFLNVRVNFYVLFSSGVSVYISTIVWKNIIFNCNRKKVEISFQLFNIFEWNMAFIFLLESWKTHPAECGFQWNW